MTNTGSITRQTTCAGARITLNKAATDRFDGNASWLQQRPYALLTPNSDGWITANNFDSDGDPPRAEPHLRMWWTPPASALPPAQQHNDDYAARVRQAATMLREASRKPGKLSNEVRAALSIMAEFEYLVREVLPDLLLPDLNPDDVRRATDTLLVLADRAEKARIRRDKLRSCHDPHSFQ